MRPLEVQASESDLQRYALLPALLEVVSLRREPAALFDDLAPRLRAIVPFDALSFALFDSVRGMMRVFLWDRAEWPRVPVEIAVDESAAGSVWRNQAPLSIADLSTETRFEMELGWLRNRAIRSYCVLPLTTVQGKWGALGFANRHARAFNSADMQILRRVATMVALSVDSTLTEAALAEQAARLRLLFEIYSSQVLASNLDQSVAALLASLQKWAAGDHVGIYLYDDATGHLRLYMTDPQAAAQMAPSGRTSLEGTLVGQAFRSRRSVVLDHAALSVSPFASVKRGLALGTRSLCLTPLLSAGGPVGVLKVGRRQDRPFSAPDVELLEQVAATVAQVFARNVKPEVSPSPEPAKSLLLFAKDAIAEGAVKRAGRLPSLTLAAGASSSEMGKPAWFGPAEALLASEQLLVTYFSASSVGLCILDSELRYIALNETLARMNGVPAQAHLGMTVRQVLGDFAELVEPQFERVFATGEPVLNLEVSFVSLTRNEPGHWIQHCVPIKDAVGRVAQIGIIAVEVTAKKKLEESLRGVSESLRQEKKRQQVLLEVSGVLTERVDVSQVFPQISAYLRRILRQEYAALSLHDEKTGSLVRQALDFPLRKSRSAAAKIGAPPDPEAQALRDRSSRILTRDEMQGSASSITDHLLTEGMQSLCCVPLVRPNGPLGVLVLGSTRVDAFKTEDLMLLNQVAAQLAIALENAAIAREVAQLRDRHVREGRYLKGEARTRLHFEEIIGESAALRAVLDQVEVVAESDATVLLLGETGTGKGVVARALHQISKRKDKAFITLNCAAIPTGLLESELFGHEKGAFTGAVNQKVGRMEVADHGTLFLDEVGEISRDLQPKLLRVLQDHEFERLGGTKTIKVDVRIIAATNRDLSRAVSEKEFRSDLFYRLNVFPVRLPSLRERREDIPLLVRYFVRKYASRMHRPIETIPIETMDALNRWDWPGNVRELENFIERSVILTEGSALQVPLNELSAESPQKEEGSLENAERAHIVQVLRESRGIISGPMGAAARLRVKRTTLQSKMEKLGITRRDYADPGAA